MRPRLRRGIDSAVPAGSRRQPRRRRPRWQVGDTRHLGLQHRATQTPRHGNTRPAERCELSVWCVPSGVHRYGPGYRRGPRGRVPAASARAPPQCACGVRSCRSGGDAAAPHRHCSRRSTPTGPKYVARKALRSLGNSRRHRSCRVLVGVPAGRHTQHPLISRARSATRSLFAVPAKAGS